MVAVVAKVAATVPPQTVIATPVKTREKMNGKSKIISSKTCGSCKHRHTDKKCRRFPPQIVTGIQFTKEGPQTVVEQFEPVVGDDYPACGEHKQKITIQ